MIIAAKTTQGSGNIEEIIVGLVDIYIIYSQ